MTSPQHTLHSMCPHIILGKDSCYISAWVFCGAKITCKNVMLTVKTAHKNPTRVDIWDSEFYSQILSYKLWLLRFCDMVFPHSCGFHGCHPLKYIHHV